MRSVLLFVLLLPTLVLAQATQTQVLPKLSICVFDPLGANGSLFNTMKDYRNVAFDWGVYLEALAYTS